MPSDHLLCNLMMKDGMICIESQHDHEIHVASKQKTQRFALFDMNDWTLKLELWGNINNEFPPYKACDFSLQYDMIAVINDLMESSTNDCLINIYKISTGEHLFTCDDFSGYDPYEQDSELITSSDLNLAFDPRGDTKCFFLVWRKVSGVALKKTSMPDYKVMGSEEIHCDAWARSGCHLLMQWDWVIENGIVVITKDLSCLDDFDSDNDDGDDSESHWGEIQGEVHYLNFDTYGNVKQCVSESLVDAVMLRYQTNDQAFSWVEILGVGKKYLVFKVQNVKDGLHYTYCVYHLPTYKQYGQLSTGLTIVHRFEQEKEHYDDQ